MSMRLLFDSDLNVQVDLPSGKVSKSGERKRLKQQQGMTCTLYALRRISIFNTTNKVDKSVLAYRKIKNALRKYNGNFDALVKLATEVFDDLDIDINKAILSNESFMYRCHQYKSVYQCSVSEIKIFNSLASFDKWILLYDIFIEKVLKPLMNIQDSGWHPRDDFKGLKESIKKKGALFFLGKFGIWCYSEAPVKLDSETTKNRQVFYFKKNTYKGDHLPFTHGIIVDQVKIINGKQMVFFRDPTFLSSTSTPEKIFMISYETFVHKLTDQQGYRVAKNKCSNNITFGLASSCPNKLYASTR